MHYKNDEQRLAGLKDKRLVIFDMDGTVYLGNTPLPGAVRLIDRINAREGRRAVFFTNNVSVNPAYYLEKLDRLGFAASREGLLTSADVLLKFLNAHRPGKSVFLLGTPSLESMFREAGTELFDCSLYEKGDMSHLPDIVVTSFDTALVYDRLERACTYIREGAEWLTTHPDINCPVEYGYIPDSGAINELIRASTGKPLPKAFGKPSGEAVDMLGEIYGEGHEHMVIFGDRLYTDIAMGRRNGMTAVLVLTGEAGLEEALALPEAERPDLIFEDLVQAEGYLF